MPGTKTSVIDNGGNPDNVVNPDIEIHDQQDDDTLPDVSEQDEDPGHVLTPDTDMTEVNNTLQPVEKKDPAEEIPELARSMPDHRPRGIKKTRSKGLATHLPPLHDLSEIFADIAKRAMRLGFDQVVSHLGGRALRVVTMCSGTESPILALEMIRDSEYHGSPSFVGRN